MVTLLEVCRVSHDCQESQFLHIFSSSQIYLLKNEQLVLKGQWKVVSDICTVLHVCVCMLVCVKCVYVCAQDCFMYACLVIHIARQNVCVFLSVCVLGCIMCLFMYAHQCELRVIMFVCLLARVSYIFHVYMRLHANLCVTWIRALFRLDVLV